MELPGLPSKRSSISKRASRKNWESRPREGRGGGNEFHISALPEEARQAIVARHLSSLRDAGLGQAAAARAKELTDQVTERHHATQRQRGLSEYMRMPEWAQRQADARMEIIRAWRHFWGHTSLSKGKARKAFARMYSDGRIDLGADIREEVESFSAITLWRWLKALREEGASGLADGRWRAESKSMIDNDEELRTVVLGMVAEHGPDVSRTNIRRELRARFPEERVPSLRTIQRYMKDWVDSNRSLASYLDAPKKWRGTHLAAFGSRDDGVTRPNQIWELDSTIADISLELEDGSVRRYALVGVIDVYTRRLRYLVTDASRSSAITLVLRRAMLAWGIPEVLRMDQGKDYTSRSLETVTNTLRIDTEFCRPYHPEEKPYIERAYRTLQHGDLELLPGYVGHDVAERQKIRERASDTFGDVPLHMGFVELSPAEFQAWLDSWCHEYERTTHSGIQCTPRERAEQYSGPIKRIHDDRVLDVLLEPVSRGGKRKVHKKGISVGGEWFTAPELGAYIGEDVTCYYDPQKAGRIMVYSDQEAAFICLAEAPETAEDRRRIATKAKKVQRQEMRERRKEMREAASEADSASAHKRILEARMRQQEDDLQLPHIAKGHTSDYIKAASDAADARERADAEREEREVTPDELEQMEQLEQREEAQRKRAEEAKRREQERLEQTRKELEEAEHTPRPQFWLNDFERWEWLQEHPDRVTEDDREWIMAYEDGLGIHEE